MNLLRTFLEIYEAKSVTRAAQELSLTQPTVSYTLARLREQLGDPLFVRGTGGLEPTARADDSNRCHATLNIASGQETPSLRQVSRLHGRHIGMHRAREIGGLGQPATAYTWPV